MSKFSLILMLLVKPNASWPLFVENVVIAYYFFLNLKDCPTSLGRDSLHAETE